MCNSYCSFDRIAWGKNVKKGKKKIEYMWKFKKEIIRRDRIGVLKRMAKHSPVVDLTRGKDDLTLRKKKKNLFII